MIFVELSAMPRTATTVINDLVRQIGKVEDISASWEIPVKRAGWDCKVKVFISLHSYSHGKFYVAVHAFGNPTDEPYRGVASCCPLSGYAVPSRLTRKWIESVLRREIETARIAALGFTESDLREGGQFDPLDEETIREYRETKEYFESTLKS